jgi:hypothetical protein
VESEITGNLQNQFKEDADVFRKKTQLKWSPSSYPPTRQPRKPEQEAIEEAHVPRKNIPYAPGAERARPSSFKKGGKVLKSGWAKVHKGERITPAAAGLGKGKRRRKKRKTRLPA